MKYLTVLGKDVELPESWAEVSWGQFLLLQEIYKNEALTDVQKRIYTLSTLSGLPVSLWDGPNNLKEYVALNASISWAYNQSYEQALDIMAKAPIMRVTHEGETVEMPVDIGNYPVSVYEEAKVPAKDYYLALADARDGKELDEAAIYRNTENIFRIYFQYVKDGEYDYQKARELDISAVPFVQVVRWRDFFLKSLNALTSGTKKDYRRFLPKLRKRQRALMNYLKVTASRIFSTSSLRET